MMIRFLVSIAVYLAANAVGLLVASFLLPGFRIDALSFVVAVAIFSVVQTVLGPLITKIAFTSFPQLIGGIALVTVFVGLFITEQLMSGMEIGGIANWLAATFLVWVGSLVASIVLPMFLVTKVVQEIRKR